MNDKRIVILLGVIALLLAGILGVSFIPKQAVINSEVGAGGGSFVPREYVVSKTLTSSDIASSTAADITVPAQGDLIVADIIAMTNGTGLASGTNFQILSDNTTGATTTATTTVAELGARKTVDFFNGSTVNERFVLTDGHKLQAKCTVADCTGAGTVTITVRFIKASPTASIYD